MGGGPTGPFEDLEVIRIEEGVSTPGVLPALWDTSAHVATLAGQGPRRPTDQRAVATTGKAGRQRVSGPARAEAPGPGGTREDPGPMVRYDGHRAWAATVLRIGREEHLIQPAQYQRERRKLAQRRGRVHGRADRSESGVAAGLQ